MPMGLSQMRQAATWVFDNFIYSGQMPSLPPIRGTWYYVDPYAGSDTGRTGKSLSKAYATFNKAYASCVSGRGDGIAVFSGGTTSAHTSTYLSEAIDWTKHGITVVGIAAPTAMFSRARITNLTSGAGLALPYLIDVSGSNNSFFNIHISNGGTNVLALGGLIVSGNRNYFSCCHIIGGGHATPSAELLANSLDLRASECVFDRCTFGSNGFTMAAANAPVLLSTTQQGQNLFDRCRIFSKSDTAGHGAIKVSGITTQNGWTEFRDLTACNFSAAGAGGQTALTSMVIGSAQNDCGIVFTGNLARPGWAAVSVLATKSYTTGPTSSTAGVSGLATIPVA